MPTQPPDSRLDQQRAGEREPRPSLPRRAVPPNAGQGRGDELLVSALAAGCSVEQAAQAAGVSVRTAYRRLASPLFQERLAAARDELVTAALGELVGCAAEAVATLRGLLQAEDERVRLGAARSVLEQLLRLRETITLAQRLAALERSLPTHQRRGRR